MPTKHKSQARAKESRALLLYDPHRAEHVALGIFGRAFQHIRRTLITKATFPQLLDGHLFLGGHLVR